MENLRVIDKEKLESIIRAGKPARIYAASRLPIVDVCEMAVTEYDNDVLAIILERLEKEKNTEEVSSAHMKLAKVKNSFIKEFVAKVANINVVLEMAVNEMGWSVVSIILKRLKSLKDKEKVLSAQMRLSKAKDWRIREFIAKVADINVVLEMAVDEVDEYVLLTIIERLESEKDTEEVKGTYKELSKAEAWMIRRFVANTAPINIVLEMEAIEENMYVYETIFERLDSKKHTEEVICVCKSISMAQYFRIREIAANIAPLDVIVEMAIIENHPDVLDIILERLEKEKDTEEVIGVYKKLSKAKSFTIRKFVAKVAPIDIVLQMEVDEKCILVIKVIIERLKPFKDTEEVRVIYNKLYKYFSKCKESYKDMSDDELIEVVEAEGDSAILKLVDEMSN